MLCCRKTKFSRLLRTAMIVLWTTMLSVSTPSRAESIQIQSVVIKAVDEGYEFDADFEIPLNLKLERALKKGIVLYFVTELSLMNDRWYWLDERVGYSRVREGLSYYALTRQYRLTRGAFTQNFNTLKAALLALSRVRDRPITMDSELKHDKEYTVEFRMWLDIAALPKPFQVETLGTKEWDLSSGILEWPTKLPAPDPQVHPSP